MAFLRSTRSSSRLVRLLEPRLPAAAEPPGMDFAERLSVWLNAFDAIHLQAAHQAIRGIASAAPAPLVRSRARSTRPAEDLRHVRSVLTRAIAQDPLADAADPAAYTPWLRRHQELQRQMEQMVGALREHVREVLAQASARLRKLAALDVAMETLLTRREQALLPTSAAVLERRHAELRRAAEDGDTAWQQAFGEEWREVLRAELELRLEPVAGLVDALEKQWNKQR